MKAPFIILLILCTYLLSGLAMQAGAQNAAEGSAIGKEVAARIAAAEKAVDKAKKKWEQLQKERDEYAAKTQNVGGRWASTTLQMYWVTRSKEMREKELKAEENNAYWEWRLNEKIKKPKNPTMNDWKETSEGEKLIKKNNKIRNELNSVYIKAINDLDRIGFKGDDGAIQALDKRQKGIIAEYQRAIEQLESLRKRYADELQHRAPAMTFHTTKEDFHINVNETAKICYYIIDGTPPYRLRISTTDGEITQEKTFTAAPTGLSCMPVKFSKPGTRTVYLDLSDSAMPRQTKIIPVVLYVSGTEKEKAKPAAKPEAKPEEKKEPVPERVEAKKLVFESVTINPNIKVGDKVTAELRVQAKGIPPGGTVPLRYKWSVDGRPPVNGKNSVTVDHNNYSAFFNVFLKFNEPGKYRWSYSVDAPGYAPISDSLVFEVTEGRKIELISAQTDPQSVKIGEKTHLKVRYQVSGILPDEKLTATTNVVVTGAQRLPFSNKTEDFSGANAKNGRAEAAIEASAGFAKAGKYEWNYSVDIPGFGPLKGEVPFSVQTKEQVVTGGGRLTGTGRWNDGPYGGPITFSIDLDPASGGGTWTAQFSGGGRNTTVNGTASGQVKGGAGSASLSGVVKFTVLTTGAIPVTLNGNINGTLAGSAINGTWSSDGGTGTFQATVR